MRLSVVSVQRLAAPLAMVWFRLFTLVFLACGIMTMVLCSCVSAHEIHLKNGRVIKTTSIQRIGDQITYQQFGGMVTISLADVAEIRYDQVKRPQPVLQAPVNSGVVPEVPGSPSVPGLTGSGGHNPTGAEDLAIQLERALKPRSPIENANTAVVSIQTEAGSGSGFFISEDGFIVTNRHVVRGSETNNRQVERQIAEGENRLAQWRRALDREQEQLRRAEKSYQHNRLVLQEAQGQEVGGPEPEQLNEFARDLRQREQTLNQWRQDYHRRVQQYQAQSREFTKQKQTFREAGQKLARQSRFTITLADGSEKSALLYRVSNHYDLALLKLNGYRTPQLLPAAIPITLGQRVYAIGSPLQLNNSVTSGVISGVRGDFLQTNAEIYPGNSGGPLVNEEGLVLGVNTMKRITEKFEGLGFALQFSTVEQEFKSYLTD